MKAPQVLAIALMALVSAPATAQTQNSPSDRAATKQQRVDRAKEQLHAEPWGRLRHARRADGMAFTGAQPPGSDPRWLAPPAADSAWTAVAALSFNRPPRTAIGQNRTFCGTALDSRGHEPKGADMCGRSLVIGVFFIRNVVPPICTQYESGLLSATLAPQCARGVVQT